MSALLQDLYRLPDLGTEDQSPHVHSVLETTALGNVEANATSNLRMVPPPHWTPPEHVARRRTFEVPEVDVSVAPRRDTQNTSRADVRGHEVVSQLLAEWHGQVVQVEADSFTAQLKGRHGIGVAGMDEEAVIPIDDVREADLELLAPGAFFSLCISYEIDATGSKRRYAEVIFRRMPSYRREELEAARARAREIVRGLRLE